MDLFGTWKKAGVTAELHVFQTGQHGFGKKGGGAVSQQQTCRIDYAEHAIEVAFAK